MTDRKTIEDLERDPQTRRFLHTLEIECKAGELWDEVSSACIGFAPVLLLQVGPRWFLYDTDGAWEEITREDLAAMIEETPPPETFVESDTLQEAEVIVGTREADRDE